MELRIYTPDIKQKKMQIQGYGLRFNDKSKDLGGFTEIIDRRALDNVDLSNVHLLYQHDQTQVLASTKSETMSLRVTDKGLYFTAELPNTSLGKDVAEILKRGDIQDMSFGFQVKEDTWNIKTTPHTRTIKKILQLTEISIVTRGAYSNTIVKPCLTNCHRKQNKLAEDAKQLLKEIK